MCDVITLHPLRQTIHEATEPNGCGTRATKEDVERQEITKKERQKGTYETAERNQTSRPREETAGVRHTRGSKEGATVQGVMGIRHDSGLAAVTAFFGTTQNDMGGFGDRERWQWVW